MRGNQLIHYSYSTQKNADDVVITLAIRTPLCKGFKGGFKDTPLDFLVYSMMKAVVEKSNLDPAVIEDVCLGNVSSSLLSSLKKPILTIESGTGFKW